jgi:hypothetical protein
MTLRDRSSDATHLIAKLPMVAARLQKVRQQKSGDGQTDEDRCQNGQQDQPFIPTPEYFWESRRCLDRGSMGYKTEYIGRLASCKVKFCKRL